jgi:hypothetical protein
VGGVQAAGEGIGQRVERDRDRERRDDRRRDRDVLRPELATAEETSTRIGAPMNRAMPASVVRIPIVTTFRPRTSRNATWSASA